MMNVIVVLIGVVLICRAVWLVRVKEYEYLEDLDNSLAKSIIFGLIGGGLMVIGCYM